MTTCEPISAREAPTRRLQKRPQTNLVSGLRGLRCGDRHHASVGGHRTAATRNRVRLPGIGCSSRIPGTYTTAYGFNTVHGRSLPIAQGIKLANPELLVLVASGDGDGFSIGGGHVPHVIRRNIDLTYIVMDNQIYGLTKGQLSPTSQRGCKTVTTNFGSLEQPVNPLLFVMGYPGASFVAQGSPADMAGLELNHRRRGHPFPGVCVHKRAVPLCDIRPGRATTQGSKEPFEEPGESMGHDPANQAAATRTGPRIRHQALYRDRFIGTPTHLQPMAKEVLTERQQALKKLAVPERDILNRFMPNN